MKKYLLLAFIHWLCFACNAYDNFEGLFTLEKPCFPVLEFPECNTTLYDAFTPEYEGEGINLKDTKIFLFTNESPEQAEELHKCGGRLPQGSTFDPDHKTALIAHGWLDGVCRLAWMRETKQQLFLRGKYNVLLVDWTWGNTLDPIGAASVNAIVVGEQVGFTLKNIMEQKGKSGRKFHLIGHSYGVQVVSQAGKWIQKHTNKKLRRITALDPGVAPLSYSNPSGRLLDHTDACFVDVIHSNAGTCVPFNFGTNGTFGHVDFFPNGGSIQPSCVPYTITSFKKFDIILAIVSLYPPICYHTQSIQFFKVSINHPHGKFIGARCESYEDFQSGECKRCCKELRNDCLVAGMDAEKSYRKKGFHKLPREVRTHYFNTANTCPYDEDYKFSVYKDC